MSARPRLLAIDLDGTLLRYDGSIDPRDLAAIRTATEAGVYVTLATGRLISGAMPTARRLDLVHPIVCADGGVMLCPRTGERYEQTPIALSVARSATRLLAARSLAPFVLMYDAVHCDESGRVHAEYVGVWSREVNVHPRLDETDRWHQEGEVAFVVGIGAHDDVVAALGDLDAAHGDAIESVRFRMHRTDVEQWVLMARPKGATKGAALGRLCTRLGVRREDTAAVGDQFNDVSMFQFVSRSFVMAEAPEPVRAAATDVLTARAGSGGGVAEAITRWLGEGDARRTG